MHALLRIHTHTWGCALLLKRHLDSQSFRQNAVLVPGQMTKLPLSHSSCPFHVVIIGCIVPIGFVRPIQEAHKSSPISFPASELGAECRLQLPVDENVHGLFRQAYRLGLREQVHGAEQRVQQVKGREHGHDDYIDLVHQA